VLVFVPGVGEIEALAERLERRAAHVSCGLHVVRLHSQLAPAEQRAAFAPPPRAGQTKVVISTDIAETSVTIDDVTLVIDGGLHRAPAIEPKTGIVSLRTSRISLAAARQRAGRAGRVRAGICYHLYCACEATVGMAAAPTAEIRRVPLEATVLRLHALCARAKGAKEGASVRAATLLADALEPPEPSAVDRAVASLVALGALESCSDGAESSSGDGPAAVEISDGAVSSGGHGPKSGGGHGSAAGEMLTPLGRRLATLPTEPRLGKALLCALALGCAEEAAVMIAAHEAAHDPFGKRSAESGRAKRELDRTSCHLALLRAYGEWRAGSGDHDGQRRLGSAKREGSVSSVAMREISRAAARLVDSALGGSARGGGKFGSTVSSGDVSSGGVSNAALAAACLLAGGGALLTRARGGGKKPLELLWRSGKTELLLRPHAGTILGGGGIAIEPSRLCVSLGAMRTAHGLFALDVTLITPLAALLFGPVPTSTLVGGGDDRPPTAATSDTGSAHAGSDGGSDGADGTISLDLAGERVEMSRADARAVGSLRTQLEQVLGCEAAASESLRRTIGVLVRGMDVPWAGLPEGWVCEADAAGAALYRSVHDPNHMSRSKPTQTAAAYAASVAAGKGSLERANAEHAAKVAERAKAAAQEKEKEAAAEAARKEANQAEDAARAAAEAAEAEARHAAAAAEQKRVTLERAAAADAAEASARRRSGVAGSVESGLAALLAELELTKYAAAFASAGYDDAALLELAEVIDADREEGGSEGAEALDEMIAAVALKGGSAVKFRKRLLEPPPKGGGGGAKGARGAKGGGGGRGKTGGGGARGSGGGGRGARGKDAKER
jgi:HrpA-like RNA helicase